jgi:bacteriorhodopsin
MIAARPQRSEFGCVFLKIWDRLVAHLHPFDRSCDREIPLNSEELCFRLGSITQLWLWLGCISMSLGAVFFGFGADHPKSKRWQIVHTLNFFICAIAASLYLAMIFKQGFTYIGDRPAYLTRYLTWTFSTPLTLILLSYLGRTNVRVWFPGFKFTPTIRTS